MVKSRLVLDFLIIMDPDNKILSLVGDVIEIDPTVVCGFTVGSVVGTVVGAMLGVGTVVGAMLGAMLGAIVGADEAIL